MKHFESIADVRRAYGRTGTTTLVTRGHRTFPVTFANPAWLTKRCRVRIPAPDLLVVAAPYDRGEPENRFPDVDVRGSSSFTRIQALRTEECALGGLTGRIVTVRVEHGHREFRWSGDLAVLEVRGEEEAIVKEATAAGDRFAFVFAVCDCAQVGVRECLNRLDSQADLWRGGLLANPPSYWLTDHLTNTGEPSPHKGTLTRSQDRGFPFQFRTIGAFPAQWAVCSSRPGGLQRNRVALFALEPAGPEAETASP